jgi:hypothetical protein
VTDAGEAERRGPTPRQLYLAYGLAILLIIGGCAGVRLLTRSDRDARSAAPSSSAASTAPVGATTLTNLQYSDLLAEADSAIGTDFRRLETDDPRTLATVGPQTAQTLYLQVGKLRAARPPAAAAAVHAQLTTALAGLGDMIQRIGTDDAGPSCPAAAETPYASLLLSDWAARVRTGSGALARIDPAFTFGKFLPPAPDVPVSRPATGTFVTAPTRRGSGELKIRNGGGDTAVSLVPAGGGTTQLFTVYVRGRSDYTVAGVAAGTYRVFYATGANWNPQRKGFMNDCAFNRFDDTFPFRAAPAISTWEITMTPVAGGNASTSKVDPGAFPAG